MTTPDLKKLAEVKRFSPCRPHKGNLWSLMAPDEDRGDWVRYSDYTTLAQEVETLRAEVKRLRESAPCGLVLRVRQETLEEAAKVCDRLATITSQHLEGHDMRHMVVEAHNDCAAAIRALQHTGEVPEDRWAGSGNYTANDEVYPTEICFANGRVVKIVNGYLVVGITK